MAGSSDSHVRAFVGPEVGLIKVSEEDTLAETESTQTVVSVGAILGLHGFIRERVSIDPALEVSWLNAWQDVEFRNQPDALNASGSGFRVLLSLGLTAFLGGAEQTSNTEIKPPQEAPSEPPKPAQAAVAPQVASPIVESPVLERIISDVDAFASIEPIVLRCVPNQPSVTLRFRLGATGVLERIEPDQTRSEAETLCLAQTIMNTRFVATGEARMLEHTFERAVSEPASVEP